MCLSGCREGHESDQTLEGRRGGSTQPPHLVTALIWGAQGEGWGLTTPSMGCVIAWHPLIQPV